MATQNRRRPSLQNEQRNFTPANLIENKNLNLNEKGFNGNCVRSRSISTTYVKSDTNQEYYCDSKEVCFQPKKDSNLSSKIYVLQPNSREYLLGKQNYKKKLKTKNTSITNNSSTLSLHIAAYENAFESNGLKRHQYSNQTVFNKRKNGSFGEHWKNVKKCFIGKTTMV
jgi:thiol:disulfide interchange protein